MEFLCGFSLGTPVSSHSPETAREVRLINYSKLPIDVKVSANGCISLYVSCAVNLMTCLGCQGYTWPLTDGIGLGSPPGFA